MCWDANAGANLVGFWNIYCCSVQRVPAHTNVAESPCKKCVNKYRPFMSTPTADNTAVDNYAGGNQILILRALP